MKTDTKIILGTIAVSLFIIIGAIIVLGKDNSPKRRSLGVASMTIDKTTADLGNMNVIDEKSAIFTITNTSTTETLRIWNVTTSCNCTFATINIDGNTTGEFSMHASGNLKKWIGELTPGNQAILTTIYRPNIMPVSGPVTRQINFSTNDPKNQDMQVSISANVQ